MKEDRKMKNKKEQNKINTRHLASPPLPPPLSTSHGLALAAIRTCRRKADAASQRERTANSWCQAVGRWREREGGWVLFKKELPERIAGVMRGLDSVGLRVCDVVAGRIV